MRARRRLQGMLTGLAVLVATACERMPDELVYAAGTVNRETGEPLVGAKLELLRAAEGYCDWQLTPVDELGLPDPTFTPVAEAVTDPKGEFLFELFYAQTERACFRLRAVDGVGGAQLGAQFQMTLGDAALQPMVLWGETPTLRSEEGRSMLLVETTPPSPVFVGERAGPNSNVFEWSAWEVWPASPAPLFERGAVPAFVLPAMGNIVGVDARLLEDFSAPQAVLGQHRTEIPEKEEVPIETGSYEPYFLQTRSPPVELPSAGRIPTSRGGACRTDDEAWAAQACPFTDGDASTSHLWLGKLLEIDLPTAARPRFVVVRAVAANVEDTAVWLRVSGTTEAGEALILGDVPLTMIRRQSLDAYWVGEGETREQPVLGYGAAALRNVDRPVRRLRVEVLRPPGEPEDWLDFKSLTELSVFE